MRFKLSILAASIAVCLPVYANSNAHISNSSAGDDSPIVVKAKQTVNMASTPNKEELQHNKTINADTVQLLQNTPGVALFSAGGVSNLPIIHGLADDRINTQIEGVQLISSCPNHMNSPLSYVTPSQVDNIKVYAGVNPVSVGGDSIGGSILVNTAKPNFATHNKLLLTGELGAYYKSNGNAYSTNLGAGIASQNFSLNYAGSIAQSDNYIAADSFKTTTETGRAGHTLAKDEVGSSAYKAMNQSLNAVTQFGNHVVQFKYGWQNTPYELYPNQRMDLLGNKQDLYQLKYDGQYAWGKLAAQAYHQKVDHYMDFGADKQYFYGGPLPLILATGMPMNTASNTNGAKLDAVVNWTAQQTVKTGLEYQAYQLDDWWPPSPADLTGMVDKNGKPATFGGMAPNTFLNINNGKRNRTAAYTELESQWNSLWSTNVGLRYEHVITNADNVQGYNDMMYGTDANNFNNINTHKRVDNNIDWSVLAQYSASKNSNYAFGVSQKTRSPNLYERYVWSNNGMALAMNNFVGDGNGYLGNIDLKPEVARTISTTATWLSENGQQNLKLTPYYTHVSDYIDALPWITATKQTTTAANHKFGALKYFNQNANIAGVDISASTELGQISAAHFELKGLLNYTKGTNTQTHDGLYNIAPLTAKAALTQHIGHWANSLEVVGVGKKTDVSHNRNEFATAGYALTNLRFNYQLKQAMVSFGVENVFDKMYYLPQGGAYTGQGMTMSLTGYPYTTAVPGMGRSLYVGFNYKF